VLSSHSSSTFLSLTVPSEFEEPVGLSQDQRADNVSVPGYTTAHKARKVGYPFILVNGCHDVDFLALRLAVLVNPARVHDEQSLTCTYFSIVRPGARWDVSPLAPISTHQNRKQMSVITVKRPSAKTATSMPPPYRWRSAEESASSVERRR